MEIEIGRGKKGRRAYGFDDIAIVPSRRTRDPEDVDLNWTIGGHTFSIPILASAMDGVVDVTTAVTLGRLGGLGLSSSRMSVRTPLIPTGVQPTGTSSGGEPENEAIPHTLRGRILGGSHG